MKITTQEEALEAVAEVCAYMKTRASSDPQESAGMTVDITETEKLARAMAGDILEAVAARGYGGCPLCMG